MPWKKKEEEENLEIKHFIFLENMALIKKLFIIIQTIKKKSLETKT